MNQWLCRLPLAVLAVLVGCSVHPAPPTSPQQWPRYYRDEQRAQQICTVWESQEECVAKRAAIDKRMREAFVALYPDMPSVASQAIIGGAVPLAETPADVVDGAESFARGQVLAGQRQEMAAALRQQDQQTQAAADAYAAQHFGCDGFAAMPTLDRRDVCITSIADLYSTEGYVRNALKDASASHGRVLATQDAGVAHTLSGQCTDAKRGILRHDQYLEAAWCTCPETGSQSRQSIAPSIANDRAELSSWFSRVCATK